MIDGNSCYFSKAIDLKVTQGDIEMMSCQGCSMFIVAPPGGLQQLPPEHTGNHCTTYRKVKIAASLHIEVILRLQQHDDII